MNKNSKRRIAFGAVKKTGLVVAGLFVLYIIVGFWVVPPLIKPVLEKELSFRLGRETKIQAIEVNPLALSVAIANLGVHEEDGESFAGFETLFFNVQLSSILNWGPTFREIRLAGPFGEIKALPEGKLSIDDILERLARPESDKDKVQDGELPRLFVTRLVVEDGKLTLVDSIGAEPIPETYFPINFTLENLSTLKQRKGSFRLEGAGRYGGRYRLEGRISVNPLRVQGTCSVKNVRLGHYWNHIRDRVSFEIAGGTAEVSGDYALEIADGSLNFTLEHGRIGIVDFQLTEKGIDAVLLSLPKLSVNGLGANLQGREIHVEQVECADGRLVSWLNTDGSFALSSMILKDLENLHGMKSSDASGPSAVQKRPWNATVGRIGVNNWSVALEDRTLPKPVRFDVTNIQANVEGLSTSAGSKADIELSMLIYQAGTLKVKGSASIVPLAVDLSVVSEKIPLKSFQPYVETAVNAIISAGDASMDGRLVYAGNQSAPRITFKGEFGLYGLVISDTTHAEDFIELPGLKTSGILLDLLPNQLEVSEVSIRSPRVRITIDEEGVLNLARAFSGVERKEEAGHGGGEKNLLQRLVEFLLVQFEGPMPMDIGLVRLEHFSGAFVDESVTPAYTSRLEITDGKVENLSSDPSSQADFRLEGRIGQSGAIKGAGRINPLNPLRHAKVEFSLDSFGLAPVSPYSGKFIGYKIAEGKLDLELKYHIEDDKVEGDNRIVLDQLNLGDRVDSPDAMDLPVALGVALLKDGNGRIAVHIPVKGDVKNPQFDLVEAILSALTETFHEVVSSPFSAVGEIDGFKGEELRTVDFEFGLSELEPSEVGKLDALAKLLKQRPALELAIQAVADRHNDWARMTRFETEKEKLGEIKVAQQPVPNVPAEPRKIDDEALKQLALNRADTVRAFLTGQGGVSTDRISLQPVRIEPNLSGEYAQAELFLTAR